ncbi:hypothetical protein K435DRAFT_867764 [Dendrothele bispora CBS 962.96]|uniref:WD40 repeat-like protein n=1 Tax=Dendrothele bispora (strain CBS 962.96) TaxID=1314807 RepID=A0A4S8LEP8_DENBC|nr:hypothetical protein K435DRAFT_867764 [Dendrothele bispora CBS 962.96]
MTWGWFVSAAFTSAFIPGLNFLSSLCAAACLTPTDPILAAAVIGGKYADKHVPAHIRHFPLKKSKLSEDSTNNVREKKKPSRTPSVSVSASKYIPTLHDYKGFIQVDSDGSEDEDTHVQPVDITQPVISADLIQSSPNFVEVSPKADGGVSKNPLQSRNVLDTQKFLKAVQDLRTRVLHPGRDSHLGTVLGVDLERIANSLQKAIAHKAVSIDSLRAETCVSVGARDQTARFWKIVDESQLVFRGGGKSKIREVLEGGLGRLDDEEDSAEREKENDVKKRFAEGSLECIAMIDESTFVTGGDSGSISLRSTSKKKPVFTQAVAHGLHEVPSETSGVIQTPRWITSIASLRYSDLFASGSWEGSIRLWQLDSKLKSFSLVGTIPAPGIVNSLRFATPSKDFFDRATWINSTTTNMRSPSTQGTENVEQQWHINGAKDAGTVNPVLLTAGLGQEPKFGRWLTLKEGASNGAMAFALMPRTPSRS